MHFDEHGRIFGYLKIMFPELSLNSVSNESENTENLGSGSYRPFRLWSDSFPGLIDPHTF